MQIFLLRWHSLIWLINYNLTQAALKRHAANPACQSRGGGLTSLLRGNKTDVGVFYSNVCMWIEPIWVFNIGFINNRGCHRVALLKNKQPSGSLTMKLMMNVSRAWMVECQQCKSTWKQALTETNFHGKGERSGTTRWRSCSWQQLHNARPPDRYECFWPAASQVVLGIWAMLSLNRCRRSRLEMRSDVSSLEANWSQTLCIKVSVRV